MRCPVLIVGAGPTGLVLALWLTAYGIKVRIIDKAAEPGTTSRALAVQARTLELYEQLDLAQAVVGHAHKVPAMALWVKGAPAARVPVMELGRGLTPYPFVQIYPQDEHERLLIAALEARGVHVERRVELVGLSQDGDHVRAQLRGPAGEEIDSEAEYVVGCDGARSRVREAIGGGFPGGTYRHLFYVADVDAAGPVANGDLHIDLDESDFLAVFPLADAGRVRLIGTVRDERADRAERLTFDDVSNRAIEHLRLEVRRVNWFSTYHVHHRVTEHFRNGRLFVAGDAAHIHSPVGGQGMNTGIGDAVNLAWKLAMVLDGVAPDALLDSYQAERIGFARRLVNTTDRIFTFVTAEGPIARQVRTRIVPVVFPRLIASAAFRDFVFRTVSQIGIRYRGSPLASGAAGKVHGGDRLPWVADPGQDNFRTLDLRWQVHAYGSAGSDLARWCDAHRVPLHVFAYTDAHARAGLARDALYLLRPDTYVALADRSGDVDALARYFATRDISLPWRA
ncbi:MAG TPA: FAD-dependent monooxygenase [Casimicrobiaceae bacterium]|nr:FAD-dependent monooxygenase [Casimicrobiaceae bacterium]